MIHIVPQHSYAASKLCDGHCPNIRSADLGTAMVCNLYAASEFGSQIRKLCLIKGQFIIHIMVTANQQVASHMAKYIVAVCREFTCCLSPWCLTVTAHNRQKPPSACASPAGCCIERHAKSYFFRERCQCPHMLFSISAPQSAHMTIFIFDLDSYNWPALIPK